MKPSILILNILIILFTINILAFFDYLGYNAYKLHGGLVVDLKLNTYIQDYISMYHPENFTKYLLKIRGNEIFFISLIVLILTKKKKKSILRFSFFLISFILLFLTGYDYGFKHLCRMIQDLSKGEFGIIPYCFRDQLQFFIYFTFSFYCLIVSIFSADLSWFEKIKILIRRNDINNED